MSDGEKYDFHITMEQLEKIVANQVLAQEARSDLQSALGIYEFILTEFDRDFLKDLKVSVGPGI